MQFRPVARNFKGGAHGYGCELEYMEENVPFLWKQMHKLISNAISYCLFISILALATHSFCYLAI